MHHSRDIPAYLPADKLHNAYNTYIYLSETYSRAPSFLTKLPRFGHICKEFYEAMQQVHLL